MNPNQDLILIQSSCPKSDHKTKDLIIKKIIPVEQTYNPRLNYYALPRVMNKKSDRISRTMTSDNSQISSSTFLSIKDSMRIQKGLTHSTKKGEGGGGGSAGEESSYNDSIEFSKKHFIESNNGSAFMQQGSSDRNHRSNHHSLQEFSMLGNAENKKMFNDKRKDNILKYQQKLRCIHEGNHAGLLKSKSMNNTKTNINPIFTIKSKNFSQVDEISPKVQKQKKDIPHEFDLQDEIFEQDLAVIDDISNKKSHAYFLPPMYKTVQSFNLIPKVSEANSEHYIRRAESNNNNDLVNTCMPAVIYNDDKLTPDKENKFSNNEDFRTHVTQFNTVDSNPSGCLTEKKISNIIPPINGVSNSEEKDHMKFKRNETFKLKALFYEKKIDENVQKLINKFTYDKTNQLILSKKQSASLDKSNSENILSCMRPAYQKFIQNAFDTETQKRLQTFEKFAFNHVERENLKEIIPFLDEMKCSSKRNGTMNIVDLWSDQLQREVLKKSDLYKEKKMVEKFSFYFNKNNKKQEKFRTFNLGAKDPVIFGRKHEEVYKNMLRMKEAKENFIKKNTTQNLNLNYFTADPLWQTEARRMVKLQNSDQFSNVMNMLSNLQLENSKDLKDIKQKQKEFKVTTHIDKKLSELNRLKKILD